MIQIIRGDILTADVDAICHQVNCKNVMGAGVAKAISDKWPVVKEKYHRCFQNLLDWHSLLGKIQTVKIAKGKYVVNVFGQDDYGGNCVHTDYSALTRAFKEINKFFAGKTVAFPYGFGCELAGGDWVDVEKMIVKLLPDCDVQIWLKA